MPRHHKLGSTGDERGKLKMQALRLKSPSGTLARVSRQASVSQDTQRDVFDLNAIVLSDRDQQEFVKTLLNPPPPGKTLLALAQFARDRLID